MDLANLVNLVNWPGPPRPKKKQWLSTLFHVTSGKQSTPTSKLFWSDNSTKQPRDAAQDGQERYVERETRELICMMLPPFHAAIGDVKRAMTARTENPRILLRPMANVVFSSTQRSPVPLPFGWSPWPWRVTTARWSGPVYTVLSAWWSTTLSLRSRCFSLRRPRVERTNKLFDFGSGFFSVFAIRDYPPFNRDDDFDFDLFSSSNRTPPLAFLCNRYPDTPNDNSEFVRI